MKVGFVAYGLWWLAWWLIQTLILHRLGADWCHASADAAISIAVLATIGFIIQITYKYYRPGGASYLTRIGYVFILSIFTLVITETLLGFYYTQFPQPGFGFGGREIRFAFILLMNVLIGVLHWLRHYIREKADEALRTSQAEAMMKKAELASIRQQLQPHFLFNSLNSISALTVVNPQAARKMVLQLADYFRSSLKHDENAIVTLDSELQQITLYLEIEKVRFGDRLRTSIQKGESTGEARLPASLLQPVLENAIKFGLYDTTDEVEIGLKVELTKSTLVIEVSNPFDPSSDIRKGTGYGLSSLQRRLYLLYARNDLMQTEQKDGLYKVKLLIPQQHL